MVVERQSSSKAEIGPCESSCLLAWHFTQNHKSGTRLRLDFVQTGRDNQIDHVKLSQDHGDQDQKMAMPIVMEIVTASPLIIIGHNIHFVRPQSRKPAQLHLAL